MIEMYFKTVRDHEFEQISEVRPGCLIYVKETSQDELKKICELTGLELPDIRDSLDRFELSRIERIDELILLFIRHPTEGELGLYTDTLTLILHPQYVLVISPGRSEVVEHILAANTSLATTQKTKLTLKILLKITQDYTANIKRVRHTILDHQQKMKVVDTDDISLMTTNEEILNQYLTALIPMRNTLKMVGEGRYFPLYEDDSDLLQDVLIAIQQSEDVCSVNIKSIRSLRDSYQIIFTNNVNRTIKLLTALTILFHIPTITASLYGMNINLPFQGHADAFWIVLVMITLISVIAILLFRRNRWL